MATTFPHYPASTLPQSEELIIYSGNQMHDIINGDALSEVTAEDGNIPTVRKAIADNYYFKSPVAWVASSNETIFNQLRKFTDGSWWWAPQATSTNPIAMGATPYNDINWKPWSKDQLAIYQNAKRLAAEAGFNMVAGSFYFGGTLNNSSDVLFYEGDGKYYNWNGTFPKVVSAGSTNSNVNWADKSGETLRTQLSRIATYASATGAFRLSDYVSIKDFGAIGDGTLHTLQEWVDSGKFSGLTAIQVAYPKATSLLQSVDYLAIQTALDLGKAVHVPYGNYIVTEEIEQIVVGQHVYFENGGGYGYGSRESSRRDWIANTRIIAQGNNFTRRIRTRRKYRGSAADTQDDPLSVVWNIQAEGVSLHNPCIWLNCDYTNYSPTNLGDDCDIGIFIGCRVGVTIENPQVIGYYRKSGIHYDVTHDTELPRHLNKAGTPYNMGMNVGGADGCRLINPFILGARRGLVVAGSLPKAGQTWYSDPYYDEQLGTTVSDSRGNFGFSDFIVHEGRCFGPDHHSNYRLADPTLFSGSLNQTSLEAEDDTMPCAVLIDGMAGNGNEVVHGMRFIGTRFSSMEAFRVRLGRAARPMFVGCHVEAGSGNVYNTSGDLLNTNDLNTVSYGHYSGSQFSKKLTIMAGLQSSNTNSGMPHYYGSDLVWINEQGDLYSKSLNNKDGSPYGIYLAEVLKMLISETTITLGTGVRMIASGGDFDVSAAGGFGLRVRSASTTVATLGSGGLSLVGTSGTVNTSAGELDLRATDTNAVRLRSGANSVARADTTEMVGYGSSVLIRSSSDNTSSVGTASARCSVIYAGTGAINTSDADEKDEFREVSEKEKNVARKLKIQAFKFKDAIKNKGSENARWHFGVVAQEVIAAFESEGLNANDYGLVCYDEWEATEEQKDKEGIVIQEAKPAGKRYGIRYDELSMFILSTLI